MQQDTNPLGKKYNVSNFSVGKIILIKDCVVRICYIENVCMYSNVFYNDVIIGYVYEINVSGIDIYLIRDVDLKIADELYISDSTLGIEFDNDIFGNVINPIGDLIITLNKNKVYSKDTKERIYKKPLPISERKSLSQQFVTGFNIVDFIYPIGYGQRMLIIGDNGTYKTSMAMQIISNFKNNEKFINTNNTKFIIVSVGKKSRDLSKVIEFLSSDNTIHNTAVIHSGANDLIGMQVLAPDAAMSLAEYLAEKYSYNVCIIIDDITKHIMSYREIKLMSNSLPGRESYPSESFYVHARMLERAGNFKNGGSITCIPIVETQSEDITSYIVTNLISITDGQLYTSPKYFKQLILPPVSTSLSISRTGSSAQSKFFKRIYNKCRLVVKNFDDVRDIYNMYRENSDDAVLEKVKLGKFVESILYINSMPNLSLLAQIVCALIIENEVFLDYFSIKDIDNDKLCLTIKNIVKDIESDASFISDLNISDIYKDEIYDKVKNFVLNYEPTVV